MSNGDAESINFEQFFWSSSDLMSILDLAGDFVLVNAAFQSILGWEREELIGRSYRSFIHPDDLERVSAAFDSENGITPSVIELEFRERCRDDSYRWMKWTVRRDGDLYYAVGHDITLRKETIEALAVSLEKSRAIFDAAVDSIIVIDKNLKVVEASPSNDSTFAFSREETEGRGALDFGAERFVTPVAIRRVPSSSRATSRKPSRLNVRWSRRKSRPKRRTSRRANSCRA